MNQQSSDQQVWEAANYIANFLARWGRIEIAQAKEKWGYARIYCYLGRASLHSLIYPQYGYNQFPQWLWNLDCTVLSRILEWKIFDWPICKWQQHVYRLGYKRGLKKFPGLHEEIIRDADWPELLGGL